MTVLTPIFRFFFSSVCCVSNHTHTVRPNAASPARACHSRCPVSYHLDINLYETLNWHQHFCAIVLDQPVAKKLKDGVRGGKKVMVMLIQLIFRFFQSKSRILVWLYEQTQMKIEGNIIGFDEYMNVVLEDACEIDTKTNSKKPFGQNNVEGENITLVQKAE